jgi:excinuclease UvrABC helicase subunit UvrB
VKKSREYKHKTIPDKIIAIQYVGDKNKYNVVEFLKGKKFEVRFAEYNEAQMSISLNNDDFFFLYNNQWLTKNEQGEIGVMSDEYLKEYYEPA